MKLAGAILAFITGLVCLTANAAPSQWEQPAAGLANEIAEILGPGQARLAIRNVSSLSNDEIPAIRRLLEQDLKSHGVLASGAESANEIRVTLSENQRERLWVAEIVEGNETHVAMVRLDPGSAQHLPTGSGVTLRVLNLMVVSDQVLFALETENGLVLVEPEEIVLYSHTAQGWQQQKRFAIGQKAALARDPRAVIVSSPGGTGFGTWLSGADCTGVYQPEQPASEWSIHCHESDDPWPIVATPIQQTDALIPTAPIRAFYNAARNYFTGVVTPGVGVDLPPFYSAVLLPRPDGAGLVINAIDGKVQIAESNTLKPVSGTRDWGSDFAALHSGCGAGTQIIASGSGEAVTDSLRAYEIPALEAVPASAPLAMDGTVTALWTAPDGKSVYAVVRNRADQYEVNRVTATCN